MAEDLVSQVPMNAPIAFATFSDDVKESVGFSAGRDAVVGKIRQLGNLPQTERKGSTAILDTVVRMVDWFGEPRPGDAIFVITDGEENYSRAHLKKVQQLILAHRVRFYALLMRSQGPFLEYTEVTPMISRGWHSKAEARS
jgi:hypothetical protein